MAKIVNCSICGKEMTKHFLGFEVKSLDVGDKMIDCCPECYARYEANQKVHAKRFAAKLRSHQMCTQQKKLSNEQIGRLYAAYREEGAQYCHGETPENQVNLGGGVHISSDGRFCATEFSNDKNHKDGSLFEVYHWYKKEKKGDGLWFNKDDISRIEFAPNGKNIYAGLINMMFCYTVRFNDESQIGYRPAISRMVVQVKFPYFARRRAEKKLRSHLDLFKKIIGSDLPIVRVTQ